MIDKKYLLGPEEESGDCSGDDWGLPYGDDYYS